MNSLKLIAATFTPFKTDSSIDFSKIAPMVDCLAEKHIGGLYVLGTTGEGLSLSTKERKEVASEFVGAARGKMPVYIQVGHNSINDACALSAHAESIEADGVSATLPSYSIPSSLDAWVAFVAKIAGSAPSLPFYYYHIPGKVNPGMPLIDFVKEAEELIPNFAGVKFTSSHLHDYLVCKNYCGSRLKMFFGADELFLPSLACGADSFIGSTYNYMSKQFFKIWNAYYSGDAGGAIEEQYKVNCVVDFILREDSHPLQKQIMGWVGLDCGSCRLPYLPAAAGRFDSIKEAITKMEVLDSNLREVVPTC